MTEWMIADVILSQFFEDITNKCPLKGERVNRRNEETDRRQETVHTYVARDLVMAIFVGKHRISTLSTSSFDFQFDDMSSFV